MIPTPQTPSEADLDWLAFCYATGELSETGLSETEQADFELRLATDQPVREALARAVELIQASLAVPTVAETPGSPAVNSVSPASSGATSKASGRGRLWAAAISLAACLALVVGLNFRHPDEAPVSPAERIAADGAASPQQVGHSGESNPGQAGPQHPASVDQDRALASTTESGTTHPQTGPLQSTASRLLTLWSDSADVSQIGLLDGALTATDPHRLNRTDDGIDAGDGGIREHSGAFDERDEFAAADPARSEFRAPSFDPEQGSQDDDTYEGGPFTEPDFAIPSWMLAAVSADGTAPAEDHRSDDWLDDPEPGSRPEEN